MYSVALAGAVVPSQGLLDLGKALTRRSRSWVVVDERIQTIFQVAEHWLWK